MNLPIGQAVHFDDCVTNPTTANVSDADSPPTFDVFDQANDTPIVASQSMTKRTSYIGDYRGTFNITASSPAFTPGHMYNVIMIATVAGVTSKKKSLTFRVGLAENTAGSPIVDAGASVLNFVVEGSVTVVQMLRGFASVFLGLCSGMGTATGTFRDINNTKNRIVVTQDADGNRTNFSTRDLS